MFHYNSAENEPHVRNAEKPPTAEPDKAAKAEDALEVKAACVAFTPPEYPPVKGVATTRIVTGKLYVDTNCRPIESA